MTPDPDWQPTMRLRWRVTPPITFPDGKKQAAWLPLLEQLWTLTEPAPQLVEGMTESEFFQDYMNWQNRSKDGIQEEWRAVPVED